MWTVLAARAVHYQPFLESLAYRLETSHGAVVFTGDTEPCRQVEDLARGADILFCMCWDHQAIMDGNGECEGQCGTIGAAEMAAASGVKRLVLVHTGPAVSRVDEQEKAVRDVSSVFHGEVLFAAEGDVISL